METHQIFTGGPCTIRITVRARRTMGGKYAYTIVRAARLKCAMDAAVSFLSDIISSLPCRKELQIDSPRVGIVKRNISAVLEACSKEENKARYTRFSIIVLAQFRHSILESITETTSSKRRERLWIAFGMLRRERLPALWKDFLDDIGCALFMEDPLFM